MSNATTGQSEIKRYLKPASMSLSDWKGDLTTFPGFTGTRPLKELQDAPWDEFCAVARREPPPAVNDKKDAEYFVPCPLREATLVGRTLEAAESKGEPTIGKMRSKSHVTEARIIVFDVDGLPESEFTRLRERLEAAQITYLAYTTHSQGREDKPGIRARVIVPVDTALNVPRYAAAWQALVAALELGEQMDPTGANMYQQQGTFCCHPDRKELAQTWENQGGVLAVEPLGAELPEPAAQPATNPAYSARNLTPPPADELTEYPPSDADKVADRCRQLWHMRKTKGADQQEPNWNNCLGVIGHCTNGREVAHDWSSGHSGYKSVETDRKLDNRLRYPPTTCEYFRQINPTGCDGCEETCKSPITLGYPSVSPGRAASVESEEKPTKALTLRVPEVESPSIKALSVVIPEMVPTVDGRPVIPVLPGQLDAVLDQSEQLLANDHYQYGGLIATVQTDPISSAPSIAPVNDSSLTRTLAHRGDWVVYRKGEWQPSDPPARHVKILHNAGQYKHLLPLLGLARQPYFHNNLLVDEPGYNADSFLYGAFAANDYDIPVNPTEADARAALALLEELLNEFKFASDVDRAAALAAIFTAVVRPGLPYAPGFHVKAPTYGSGKSYLCNLIGAFATPGENAKVSYPKGTEEATKVILALLLTSPAVIEFDDMDMDWLPHGSILRALTAESITDRVLGYSRTVEVRTRTLFLGSGNNVGPIRDMLRRVLTINVDRRSSTPANDRYVGDPVAQVREHRGRYVSAVLTIIQAWLRGGTTQPGAGNIVTYNGLWSDYCRQPLLWLGHPDPATRLIEQVQADPDGDTLFVLLREWYRVFGNQATTVRKALKAAEYDGDEALRDAICDFPVETPGGTINPGKLGWLLKKHSYRPVGGLKIQPAKVDGRQGWQVVGELEQAESVDGEDSVDIGF